MKKGQARKVIQKHHITYEPEVTVKLTRAEHWRITKHQRIKNATVGYLKAMRADLDRLEREGNIRDLDDVERK